MIPHSPRVRLVMVLVLSVGINLEQGHSCSQYHGRLCRWLGWRRAYSGQEQLNLGLFIPLSVGRPPPPHIRRREANMPTKFIDDVGVTERDGVLLCVTSLGICGAVIVRCYFPPAFLAVIKKSNF